MPIIPLHGATGFWDEIICLALPATAIMGVALALLRQERKQGFDADPEVDDEPTAALAPAAARRDDDAE